MAGRAQFSYVGFYTGQYVLLGVQLPFFSAWLALQGFTAPEIGWVTGIALAARLMLGPIVAIWSDALRDDTLAMKVVSVIFAAAAIGLVFEPGKVVIALLAAVVLWSFGVLVPLSDSAVLRADRAGLLHYGQTRALGSAAFLAANILGGVWLTRFGIEWSVVIMAASASLAFGFSLTLPRLNSTDATAVSARARMAEPAADLRPHEAAGPARGDLWRLAPRLLSDYRFLLLILAAGFVQGGHAVYYTFSILRWSEIGYSPQLVGVLWAIGVAAEIVLLSFARRLTGRFSPAALIAIGGVAAAVRWTWTAFEPPVGVLAGLQCLHALTFAATYLGSVEFIDRAVPKRLAATAMTLMSATGVGALTGLATIVAGYVVAAEGIGGVGETSGVAAAYLLMGAMGAAAVMLAALLGRVWRGETLF